VRGVNGGIFAVTELGARHEAEGERSGKIAHSFGISSYRYSCYGGTRSPSPRRSHAAHQKRCNAQLSNRILNLQNFRAIPAQRCIWQRSQGFKEAPFSSVQPTSRSIASLARAEACLPILCDTGGHAPPPKCGGWTTVTVEPSIPASEPARAPPIAHSESLGTPGTVPAGLLDKRLKAIAAPAIWPLWQDSGLGAGYAAVDFERLASDHDDRRSSRATGLDRSV
jgi:hypothetical protein